MNLPPRRSDPRARDIFVIITIKMIDQYPYVDYPSNYGGDECMEDDPNHLKEEQYRTAEDLPPRNNFLPQKLTRADNLRWSSEIHLL